MNEVHNRWEEEHRQVCEDCRADWLDEMFEMTADAKLDAMMEEAE